VAAVTANRTHGLARFALATLPTPLVPAVRLQAAVGGPLVWVKRDDLAGFATAGNKARALEFLIGDAIARGCDTVVTGGGAGSNFCAATAAAARVAGLGCHLVLYGSAPGDGEAPHANLAAAWAAGAQIRFTGRTDRDEIDRAVPEMAAALEAGGQRPYPMARGGATALGAAGYVEAFDELARQLGEQGVEPGVVLVATGSGATQAGLVAGAVSGPGESGPPVPILGATVSRPPDQIGAEVAALARNCGDLLGLAPPVEPDAFRVVDARGPGFGVASREGERAAGVAAATEGLLLDPVYTAKAFAVVLGLLADGFERPIVFWHTGGLPAAVHHLTSSERSALCPT